MRIALCSKGNFSLEKGFTKNRLELAESLEKVGWETVLVDKKALGIPDREKYNPDRHSKALKDFLIAYSAEFDVVLYEYDTLPFDRKMFCERTLFVARPAILGYHFKNIGFRYDTKTRISNFLKTAKGIFQNKNKTLENLHKIDYCLDQADVIQVQNKKDYELLLKRGYGAEKLMIVPNGITEKNMKVFSPNSMNIDTDQITLAFVGTFDFRKGALDLVFLFKSLKKRFPEMRLKLLGTKGMFQTEDQVLRFFPRGIREYIQVVPRYNAQQLPQLLKGAHIGVFPSYLESFGFGALEMMCAGLPVVAYDAPGPSDFIIPDLLVKTGDREQLLGKVLHLIENPEVYDAHSRKAREIVEENYCWEKIGEAVDSAYRRMLSKKELLHV